MTCYAQSKHEADFFKRLTLVKYYGLNKLNTED